MLVRVEMESMNGEEMVDIITGKIDLSILKLDKMRR